MNASAGRTRAGLAAVLLCLGLGPIRAADAADTTRPKIVKATMRDVDRDDRADRVVLTYSERIRHALDTDGRYPFAVSDHAVAKVLGASNVRTLVIVLKEKKAADIAARPSVRYSPTASKPVKDARGNQAVKQTFRSTVPLDVDADGYARLDCAPRNRLVNPGATDLPDLRLLDANCDGLDGDPDDAIFVSPPGADGSPGTRSEPKATIAAAVQAAAAAGKDVYAAQGIYEETQPVELVGGVGIYGGFSTGWSRSSDRSLTSISAAATGAVADGDQGVVLQLLSLRGRGWGTEASGSTAYGLIARAGSELKLQAVAVTAGNGAAGAAGAPAPGPAGGGLPGAAGQPGVEHSDGICDSGSRPQGGLGGSSPGGASGGAGGAAGHAGNSGSPGAAGGPAGLGGAPGLGTPPGRGNWTPPSEYAGRDGSAGGPGAPGPIGAVGFGPAGLVPVSGGDGTAGTFGRGGGGGGGGGGGTEDCDSYGGGGGGGGAGGHPGVGGKGGTSGGGSVGIYVSDSSLTISASSISTGNGGNGGEGASGQLGGPGGPGGACGGAGNCYGGSSEQDDGSNGGRGGNGGAGGNGGPGGGGAGGPSFGIVLHGASVLGQTSTTFVVGQGGAGGAGPGNAGPSGGSQAVVDA